MIERSEVYIYNVDLLSLPPHISLSSGDGSKKDYRLDNIDIRDFLSKLKHQIFEFSPHFSSHYIKKDIKF